MLQGTGFPMFSSLSSPAQYLADATVRYSELAADVARSHAAVR